MKHFQKALAVVLALLLTASLFSVTALADGDDPSGKLIASYSFDDGNTKDSVGINHAVLYNGKVVSDAVFTDGVVGKALQLSTKGKMEAYWLSIPYDVFDGNQDSFSLSMWYMATGYNTTGEDSELFSFYNTSIENFMFYSPASAAFQDKAFTMKWNGLTQGYGYANVISPYNPGNWVHLVFCVDAVDGQSVITAYINGASVDVDQGGDWSGSLMSALGMDNFTIGGKNPYKGGETPMCLFYGAVDEVQIYSGVLSQAEAAYLYNKTGYSAVPAVAPAATEGSTETTAQASETAVTESAAEETKATSAAGETKEAESGLNTTGKIGWIVAGVVLAAAIVLVVLYFVKKKKK